MTVATTAAGPDPEVLSGTVTAARRPAMGDPGPSGRFGPYGGRFVPEALVPACEQLEEAFSASADRTHKSKRNPALRSAFKSTFLTAACVRRTVHVSPYFSIASC